MCLFVALLVFCSWPSSVRSAFAFASSARATLTLAGTRLVDRIRTCAASHRGLGIENLATINPNLHADLAKRRLCFGETVIDVGAQRVKRKLPLQVPLTASDFSPIQTTTDLDFDSLRPKPQRLFHGFSHRASKRDAFLELRGDLFRLELSIQLGLVDLLDGHQDFPARLRRKIALELVDLRALSTDDDARTRRVDDDFETICGPFDVDVRHARARKTLLQIAFQLQIFEQELAELSLGKPVRVPIFVVAESKTVWMNFLTHNFLQCCLYSSVWGFFFEALLVAGFSAVASGSSFFEAARFALGAAAAPPRLRRLLSSSFAGFASASGLPPSAVGRASLLNEIVT